MKRKEKKPNRPCGMSAEPDVLTDEPRSLSDSLRPGNARRKVRGRNHVQLPMISYIWLT